MRKCSSHSLNTAPFIAFALISSSFGQRKSALSGVLQRVQKNCPFVERRRGVGIRSVSHNSIGETSPLHSSSDQWQRSILQAGSCAKVSPALIPSQDLMASAFGMPTLSQNSRKDGAPSAETASTNSTRRLGDPPPCSRQLRRTGRY